MGTIEPIPFSLVGFLCCPAGQLANEPAHWTQLDLPYLQSERWVAFTKATNTDKIDPVLVGGVSGLPSWPTSLCPGCTLGAAGDVLSAAEDVGCSWRCLICSWNCLICSWGCLICSWERWAALFLDRDPTKYRV
jgi:hypothetical protein